MKTKNYSIKWSYEETHLSRHKYTYCKISNNKTTIVVSCAICSESDNFSRDAGRKISLARALKGAHIPKEERKEIWEAYRMMKPGGRW